MKSEKGAITLYVTIACLFVLIIGIANYVVISNKQAAQIEMMEEIERLNNADPSDEDIAKGHIGGDIVPIYTLEDFKKIGTGERVYINGQYYTFGANNTYVLQNNLVYDGDYSQMIDRIKNNNLVVTGDGYEIAVTTNGVTDYYVSKWNYTVPRGKVYGSLYKISDDEYHLIFNATGNLAKGYTEAQRVAPGVSPDISGGCERILLSNGEWISTQNWGSFSDKIIKCKIEEEINPLSTENYFAGLSQIIEIEGIQNINTSKVTSMAGMFIHCRNLRSIDLSRFDTSKVTNMQAMFNGCNRLTRLELSGFDTSKVTNMRTMFRGDENLTYLNISSFDTSNVETMNGMFYNCQSLTSLYLSSFDTSKVTDMKNMFWGSPDLKTIYVGDSWIISTITGDGSTNLFGNCASLVGAIAYDSTKTDATYANWATGYLTYKAKDLSEYQNLSYIESTGTQYIDSGYNPKPQTAIEVEYQYTSTTPDQQAIYGIYGTSSDTASFTYGYYINSSYKMAYGYKDCAGNWKSINIDADTNKHNFRFNMDLGYWKLDNGENTKIATATTTNTATHNMLILAATYDGVNVPSNYKAKAKLYLLKIYENGTLVRDFVPCKVKADNSIGLYDRLTGIFYPNKGTGTFTPGPNV